MARGHRWQARRRLRVGPFYRTYGATVDHRGARTSVGPWHLKVTRKLSLNLEAGTYHWDHDGPGAVSGPVPGWHAVRGLLLVMGAIVALVAAALVVVVTYFVLTALY